MLICLRVICSCFHTAVAELSSCNRGCLPTKPKMLAVALYRSLPAPDLIDSEILQKQLLALKIGAAIGAFLSSVIAKERIC